MGAPCEAKGANLVALLDAMRSLRGEDAVRELKAEVRGPLSELLAKKMLNEGAWYPIAYFAELHRAAEVVAGGPIARELGYVATKDLFSKAYRVFARILGPKTSWRHSAHAFRSFYRPADIEVLEARRGRLRGRARGCAGFDDRIWEDVIGSSVAVVEIAGGKDPRATVVSRSEDGPFLELRIDWD